MRPLPAPLLPDLALAVALAAWWVADVGDSSAVGVTSLALMTVPLGWRRAAPLAAVTLVAGGFAASGLEQHPPEPLPQLVAALVANFSVAAHAGSWRTAALGLAAGVSGGLGEAVLLGGEDAGFLMVLTLAAWVSGAAVRRLTGRSAELEARAEELRARTLTAAAAERERIARELHDVVSHSVSLMVVQAAAAERVLRQQPDEAERALRAVQATGRSAVDDLRRMLGLLRAPDTGERSRAPQPGLATLDDLVAAQGPSVALEHDGLPRLPAGVDLAAYRIVQEALTNARRHAPGRPTRVHVSCSGGMLQLDVRTTTPPRGSAPPAGTGHGLLGMRERVEMYGGTLEAGFDASEDWVVRARLPVGVAP